MRELKLDGECFLLAEQHLILEIHSKYFDKSSEYYEANLTDTERRIAYNYEMQNALNVGNNGKNLYKHIYYCSTQDGCESSQVTEESKMKYEAYHQVYSYTGWTLEQYEGQYRAAMYAAVKSANPNWKPGQKFDTSILDNVTRESVESTLVKNGNRLVRNSIDVSV